MGTFATSCREEVRFCFSFFFFWAPFPSFSSFSLDLTLEGLREIERIRALRRFVLDYSKASAIMMALRTCAIVFALLFVSVGVAASPCRWSKRLLFPWTWRRTRMEILRLEDVARLPWQMQQQIRTPTKSDPKFRREAGKVLKRRSHESLQEMFNRLQQEVRGVHRKVRQVQIQAVKRALILQPELKFQTSIGCHRKLVR